MDEKKELEKIPSVVYESEDDSINKILITNTHTKLSSLSDIELQDTKLLIHPNSGYDNFDVDFVKSVDFPIVIGNSIRAQAVSNYILSCLFGHYSKVIHHTQWSKDRIWDRGLISQKKILIIGHGMIGKILESSLKPLSLETTVYDPYKGLSKLSSQYDVVLMACSLTPSSTNIINKSFLNNLAEDYVLINAARGKLINESDLISSLELRPNAYAYLDVFWQEPCDLKKWNCLSNVSCTSHIAGVFESLNESIIGFEKEVINDFLTYQNDMDTFIDKYYHMILQKRVNEGFLI